MDVRRGRWGLAACAVLLVLAGVLLVPRLAGTDDPGRAGTGTGCVEAPHAPAEEIGTQEVAWVRFCPLAEEGLAQRLRHPQGVVTGDLAAAVAASLWATQAGRRVCAPDEATLGPTGLFRIEVGLADGRVAELAGDTGCSSQDRVLFSQLETTLLMDAAPAGPPPERPDPVPCPRRFTTTATGADGASADLLVETAEHPWTSTVPLLPMPAVAADVCAYTGGGDVRRLVGQWQVGPAQAEPLRSAATTEVLRGAVADCDVDPARTSYVVVLSDATGTARTLTIDPTACGPVSAAIGTPAVDTWLGLATDRLVRLVAGTRP